MTPDEQTERVEKVAWAIADVIANRRCDGKPAINDQRRAEARAAIAAMNDAYMDRLVAEGQKCDAIAKARNDALREAADLMKAASANCRDKFTYPPKNKEERDYQTGALIHANAAQAILALIKEPTP